VRKYLVEITKIAEQDICSVFKYIARDNPGSAAGWVREIERQINSLERFPERCPIVPESEELGKEYRHFIYGNYRPIFRVERSKVLIMRVIHGSSLLDFAIFDK
jgi:plasmid stabilization system protein ParE